MTTQDTTIALIVYEVEVVLYTTLDIPMGHRPDVVTRQPEHYSLNTGIVSMNEIPPFLIVQPEIPGPYTVAVAQKTCADDGVPLINEALMVVGQVGNVEAKGNDRWR